MTEAQIKHMVNRFLAWKLPENFHPDGGISFKRTFNEHTAHPMKHEPSGTNLFDATQADAMVRYITEALPEMQPRVTDNDHWYPVESENGRVTTTSREANARLIAAAPELLAALEGMESFVAVMVGHGPDATIPDVINSPIGIPIKVGELVRRAQTAITKATNKQHDAPIAGQSNAPTENK